jgi:hypothetical protein
MADGSGVYAYADPKRRIQEIIDEAEQCFADRQTVLSRWQEITDLVIPGIADFTVMRSPARSA